MHAKETQFPGALPALEARSNRERLDEKGPGGTKVVRTMKGTENFALEAIRIRGIWDSHGGRGGRGPACARDASARQGGA